MIRQLLDTRAISDYKHAMVLLLRVGVSALMMTHGFPKLMRLLNGNFKISDPLGLGNEVTLVLAVFAEFFCSILVFIGLGTRLAVIPLILTMAVAAFLVHAADPFVKQELPMLYMLIYITLLIGGSGKYSLDERLFGQKD